MKFTVILFKFLTKLSKEVKISAQIQDTDGPPLGGRIPKSAQNPPENDNLHSKIKRQHCALHIQTKALGKLYCAANNNWGLLLIFTEELDVVIEGIPPHTTTKQGVTTTVRGEDRAVT